MSKCHKVKKSSLGLIAISVGVGILLVVILPVWGWLLAVGGGLIYLGWYLIEHHNN